MVRNIICEIKGEGTELMRAERRRRLLCLVVCIWSMALLCACQKKQETVQEHTLSESQYGKRLDAYLDYARAHGNAHTGYGSSFAIMLDADDEPILIIRYQKSKEIDYNEESVSEETPQQYWQFYGYDRGEVGMIYELSASQDGLIYVTTDGIVAKIESAKDGEVYQIKKGEATSLYSYVIDKEQGIAQVNLNQNDNKTFLQFEDEDGIAATAATYEKEIKTLFRKIYGTTKYYTSQIQKLTLYELLADQTIAVSPSLYIWEDYKEDMRLYDSSQFQSVIAKMKEEWVHTPETLYQFGANEAYACVKKEHPDDSWYRLDFDGVLRRDINWLSGMDYVDELNKGSFFDCLYGLSRRYSYNSFVNPFLNQCFADSTDLEWLKKQAGDSDDQQAMKAEMSAEEKNINLMLFGQWFSSKDRQAQYDAWLKAAGRESPLVGYWQGDGVGMEVHYYTDVAYGGLYFYLCTNELTVKSLSAGNAETMSLGDGIELSITDDTHCTLIVKDYEGKETTFSLTKGEVDQSVIDSYMGNWVQQGNVETVGSIVELSYDDEYGDIHVNNAIEKNWTHDIHTTVLYNGKDMLICLGTDDKQVATEETYKFPQYQEQVLSLQDNGVLYKYFCEPGTISMAEELVRVKDGEETWEAAYQAVMNNIEDTQCALFYLDDDDIPEIFFLNGARVCTFRDNAVVEYEKDSEAKKLNGTDYLVYVPKQGLYTLHSGSNLYWFELKGDWIQYINGATEPGFMGDINELTEEEKAELEKDGKPIIAIESYQDKGYQAKEAKFCSTVSEAKSALSEN